MTRRFNQENTLQSDESSYGSSDNEYSSDDNSDSEESVLSAMEVKQENNGTRGEGKGKEPKQESDEKKEMGDNNAGDDLSDTDNSDDEKQSDCGLSGSEDEDVEINKKNGGGYEETGPNSEVDALACEKREGETKDEKKKRDLDDKEKREIEGDQNGRHYDENPDCDGATNISGSPEIDHMEGSDLEAVEAVGLHKIMGRKHEEANTQDSASNILPSKVHKQESQREVSDNRHSKMLSQRDEDVQVTSETEPETENNQELEEKTSFRGQGSKQKGAEVKQGTVVNRGVVVATKDLTRITTFDGKHKKSRSRKGNHGINGNRNEKVKGKTSLEEIKSTESLQMKIEKRELQSTVKENILTRQTKPQGDWQEKEKAEVNRKPMKQNLSPVLKRRQMPKTTIRDRILSSGGSGGDLLRKSLDSALLQARRTPNPSHCFSRHMQSVKRDGGVEEHHRVEIPSPAKSRSAHKPQGHPGGERDDDPVDIKQNWFFEESGDSAALKIPQQLPKPAKRGKIMTMKQFEKERTKLHMSQTFARIHRTKHSVDCHIDAKILDRTGVSKKQVRTQQNYNSLMALENVQFFNLLQDQKSVYTRDSQLKEYQKHYSLIMGRKKNRLGNLKSESKITDSGQGIADEELPASRDAESLTHMT